MNENDCPENIILKISDSYSQNQWISDLVAKYIFYKKRDQYLYQTEYKDLWLPRKAYYNGAKCYSIYWDRELGNAKHVPKIAYKNYDQQKALGNILVSRNIKHYQEVAIVKYKTELLDSIRAEHLDEINAHLREVRSRRGRPNMKIINTLENWINRSYGSHYSVDILLGNMIIELDGYDHDYLCDKLRDEYITSLTGIPVYHMKRFHQTKKDGNYRIEEDDALLEKYLGMNTGIDAFKAIDQISLLSAMLSYCYEKTGDGKVCKVDKAIPLLIHYNEDTNPGKNTSIDYIGSLCDRHNIKFSRSTYRDFQQVYKELLGAENFIDDKRPFILWELQKLLGPEILNNG